MSKKLTLEQTWAKCLKMWRWIVAEWEKNNRQCVVRLKRDWLKKYCPNDYIIAACFFCDWDEVHLPDTGIDCTNCPGKLVSLRFHCENKTYHYAFHPDKFLAKLEALNRERKAKI